MATELLDTNFLEVQQGAWPSITTDYRSTLTERAFFIQNSPKNLETGEILLGWKPRVFVMDDRRVKVISGSEGGTRDGNRRTTMLDPTGETTVVAVSATANSMTVTDGDTILGDNLEGCTLYVLDGDRRGNKAIITTVTPNDVASTSVLSLSPSNQVSAGDTVAISPVFTRVLLGPAYHQDVASQDNRVNDFHEIRMLSQLGPTFVDVQDSGHYVSSLGPFYQSVIYRGTAVLPVETSVPTSESGVAVTSIREDERQYLASFGAQTGYERKQGVSGVNLSCGIETFYPDIDWRLLGIMVKGKLYPTNTRRAPGTGP